MSLYHSLYVGPYLRLWTKKGELENTKRVCSHRVKHRISYDDKFCPKCGYKIITLSKPITAILGLRDFLEENEKYQHYEDIFEVNTFIDSGDFEIIMPMGDIGKYLEAEYGCSNEVPFLVEEKSEAINALYTPHKDFFTDLRHWTQIEFQYGVLSWWS